MSKDILSIMQMDTIFFDAFSFKRYGFGSNNELETTFETEISVNETSTTFKVSIRAQLVKKDEYDLTVTIVGMFHFTQDITEEQKEVLLSKNAVAILMPHLRSHIMLLTTQPELEAVILPIYNIDNMVDNEK